MCGLFGDLHITNVVIRKHIRDLQIQASGQPIKLSKILQSLRSYCQKQKLTASYIQSLIMSQQNLIKSKKSSRLNAKKEDKVELLIDKTWNSVSVDLAVYYEEKLNDSPKILRNLALYLNQKQEIISYPLADYLRNNEICKQDSTISFWDKYKSIYVFGFNVTKDVKDIRRNIPSKYIQDNLLTIKIRGKRKLIVESLIEEQRVKYEEDDLNNKNKEKKIGEVVEKVALWRKFYTGFYDQFGNYVQKPLETAAQEVGIAKKTLDDYLLQIRNGKKYGFNFNDKVNAKIGELRAFVRDQKKKETTGK